MDFDYEVTLSPDNNKKWNEMMTDSEGREVMLKIYKLIVESDRDSVNDIVEKAYLSYKEGSLSRHFESFKKLYEASDFLKDYEI